MTNMGSDIGYSPIDTKINFRGNGRFLDDELIDFKGTMILLQFQHKCILSQAYIFSISCFLKSETHSAIINFQYSTDKASTA